MTVVGTPTNASKTPKTISALFLGARAKMALKAIAKEKAMRAAVEDT
jgi:hypothetical protein